MANTLQKLKSWINVIHNSILVIAAIEVIIVLIIGIASNNLTGESSSFWLSILFILGIIYILITIGKIAYNKSFPITIIEELKSKEELAEALKSNNRKDAIISYISNTVF